MTVPKEFPMKSLVITCRRLDVLQGGAALRVWQSVYGLARLGPVDVVTIGSTEGGHPGDEVRNYQFLDRSQFENQWLKRFVRGGWYFSSTAHPMLASHFNRNAATRISKCVRSTEYDLAVIEELPMIRYVSALQGNVNHLVFNAHNVESALHSDIGRSASRVSEAGALMRFKRRLLDKRLAEAELSHSGRFDRIWACSKLDQQGFSCMLQGKVPVDVIPNSISINRYTDPLRVPAGVEWSNHPVTMVYLGSYSYYPNEEAALSLIREVLPLLKQKVGNAKLVLIGTGPTESMKIAAAGNEDVVITGKVESILPYLAAPCVVTIPLRLGSGTRLKVLEAFASGRPVVSTAKGAEGLDVRDEEDLLLRESPEDMASAVASLWNDTVKRARISENGLQIAKQKYSYESASRMIGQSVSEILGGKSSQRAER